MVKLRLSRWFDANIKVIVGPLKPRFQVFPKSVLPSALPGTSQLNVMHLIWVLLQSNGLHKYFVIL